MRFVPSSLICLAAVSSFLLAVTGAGAQGPVETDGREVPLGTFNLGSPHSGFSVVEPPAGVPDREADGNESGSGRWFFQGWQRAPQADAAEPLYERAMTALETGHPDEAQRLFERLISEAPRSRRAGEARQHLGRLYRNVETGATASAHAQSAQAQSPQTQDSETRTAETHSAAPQADVPAGAEALPWAGGEAAAVAARPAVAALNVIPALPQAVVLQARVSASIDARFLQNAGDRVFFSAGSAVLGMRARTAIQAQARFLLSNPALSAAIEGHADDGALPSDGTLRLSQERAAMVRERLIAEGVAPERLTAYGRGREDRVANCAAPECLAQNRRVVTILLNRRIGFDDPARRAQKNVGDGAPPVSVP